MANLPIEGERGASLPETDREACATEIEKILASREFVRAERLSRFLRYVTERSLEQPPNPPKEHEVALEVFGRGNSFDSRIDSIVRVQANRLRSRLAEFYQNAGSDDAILVEIPAGSYTVVFRRRFRAGERDAERNEEKRSEVGQEEPPKASGRKRVWVSVLATLAVAAVLLWRSRDPAAAPEPDPEPVPVTTYDGRESDPTLSPDGAYVAFTWEKGGTTDIYVQRIGSSAPVRLTRDPAPEFGPAWSPDGKWIAYFREAGPTLELHLTTPVGERGPMVATVYGSSSAAWTPDSRWLAVSDAATPRDPSALFLVSLEARERRRLTTPGGNISGDFRPAISPDGRILAFVRANSVMSLALTKSLEPAGEPRRVFSGDPLEVSGIAWTPDSRDLLLCGKTVTFEHRLWRVPVDGSAPPRRLSYAGAAGLSASVSRPDASGHARLVYARELYDSDIWRLDIGDTGEGAGSPLIASTRNDSSPQYSPDGKRVAFASDRSGSFEVWISDADGSRQERLTRRNSYSATPRWSPDGKQIAFDGLVDGQWEIFAIEANDGTPRQITNHPAFDAIPSWSRNGAWIYFTSDRTGEFQVWKAPAAGGEPVQVTRSGGHVAFESFDGKLVYYTKTSKLDSPLWSVPVEGGEEKEVLDSVGWRGFAPVRDGIWFLSRAGPKIRIQFHGFGGGVRTLALFTRPGVGLTVSPDGSSLLYTQRQPIGGDLMLVEDFR
jgi:Tol biopolymer transport system component